MHMETGSDIINTTQTSVVSDRKVQAVTVPPIATTGWPLASHSPELPLPFLIRIWLKLGAPLSLLSLETTICVLGAGLG